MPAVIRRALVLALLGAVAGAVFLLVATAIHPDVSFEMDRDLPKIAVGFYPPERSGDDTFAWTAGRARVLLAGLDRRRPWTCVVRFRGGRPAGADGPSVQLAIDGSVVAAGTATEIYRTLKATAPARAQSGMAIAIVTAPTFAPGGQDTRELGVQVDRLACRPAASPIVLPPRTALVAASAAGALFGAAFVLSGFASGAAVVALLLLAAAQSIPLALGAAPYTKYPDVVTGIAFWIGGSAVVLTRAIQWRQREPLGRSAQAVVLISSGTLYLKLVALLHPAKLVVDAVFHAHRFEWVLAGRYFFTQPIQNTEFPYAIALYLFAAPWSVVTANHVALLRVTVAAAEAVAGGLLYWAIVRVWADRVAGVLAVALFSLVPLSYTVLGNANLTNAFGQSVALIAVIAATGWRLRSTDVGQLAGLSALIALALLSHVSTFALLSTTVFALALAYFSLGGSALRGPATAISIALVTALVTSIVTYYGHFGQVRQMVGRVGAAPPISLTTDQAPETGDSRSQSSGQGPGDSRTPVSRKAVKGLFQSVSDIGWPILVLSASGLWRLRTGPRDRLIFALLAWGTTYLVFFAAGTFAPVGARYERYALEFVSRLDYATCPALAILAARGASWAWQGGRLARLIVIVLAISAVVLGYHEWTGWIA